jgi:flagellar basal-body rod modification protein FlgD
MTVSNVSNTGASAAATSTASSTQSVNEAQTNFLKLLVTQMQNQDPMNPMDNAQMTSQIAQLNTVSGINQLNTTVQSLASTMQASQALQASSLLGRDVLVAGSSVQLAQGQAAMAMDLDKAADAVTLTVKDSAGKVVRTLSAGPQPAGPQNIFWDGSTDAGGSAADGNYSFEVQALRNGQAVTATTLAAGRVDSVSMAASGLTLSVAGVGNVALADVKQVR